MVQGKSSQVDLRKNLEKTISLTMSLLRSLGMWSTGADSTFNVHNGLVFVQMLTGLTVLILDVYMALPDIVEATKFACFFFASLLPALKMINFLYWRPKIMNLHNIMLNIFWNDLGAHPDNPQSIVSDARRGSLLVTLITGMTFETGCLVLVLPLFNMLQEHRANKPVTRQLPFPLYPPFGIDPLASPLYELAFTTEVFLVIFTLLVIASFDSIFIIYVINTAGHFKVLRNNIKLIGTNSAGGIEAEEFDAETEIMLYDEFSVCIQKHYLLLECAEDLETVFTVPLLIQFSISSLFLCLCGVQIITQGGVMALMLFTSYFVTSLLQLFVYCWTCNEIVTASGEVCDAVYACGWWRARGRGWREAACLCAARAQRPCALTAGHFYPVTLETFTTILRTAGSYFTLLTTVMQD